MEKTVKMIMNPHGFTPGIDISVDDWDKIQAEFIMMYNTYASNMNKMYDRLNKTWNNYQTIKSSGSFYQINMMQELMEIDDTTTYTDWIEKWAKEVTIAVDKSYPWASVKGNIFRDGDLPIYGCILKKNPKWTLDFSLEEL